MKKKFSNKGSTKRSLKNEKAIKEKLESVIEENADLNFNLSTKNAWDPYYSGPGSKLLYKKFKTRWKRILGILLLLFILIVLILGFITALI